MIEVALEAFKAGHGFDSQAKLLAALKKPDWWIEIPLSWIQLAETPGSELQNCKMIGLNCLAVSDKDKIWVFDVPAIAHEYALAQTLVVIEDTLLLNYGT